MTDDLRDDRAPEAIAVTGMACRLPGARDLEELWANLRGGVESITFFGRDELLAAGEDPAAVDDPAYVPAAPILDGPDLFDAAFFDFSPREAEVLDPQHRLFLEVAWEALERAGHGAVGDSMPVGVFAGTSISSYLLRNLFANLPVLNAVGFFHAYLANDRDYFPTRLSYKLDLRGPSVNVQTACSTSLVAVHLACQSLLDYQCDMAVAGGSRVDVPQVKGYRYQPGTIVSPDGHCRAFDAAGEGSIFGSGVGAVVLRRLSDALADGDPVAAVILGSAVNNDGGLKVGYTAPSVDGQAEVIAMAQAVAGVDPETVGYVEAHGSGTPLGDPIEVAALTEAFRAHTERRGFCALGSVKSNFGHLEATAGVAGLIKTVLALEHREIPPTLHVAEPNPRIDFAASPFRLATEATGWESPGGPRRAGVSSFGIGGTNCHLVLEEAPEPEPGGPSRREQLLALSARSEAALEEATDRLAAHLEERPESPLGDVAFTLHRGRRAFEHRRALVAATAPEAARALAGRDPRRLLSSYVEAGSRRPVTFLISGLGDHYPGMARALYEGEAPFREALERCAEVLAGAGGPDVLELLYPAEAPGPSGTGSEARQPGSAAPDLRRMLGRGGEAAQAPASRRLGRTAAVQPVLFAVEYALARLWMAWGVVPEAMVGYSLGEYVAAALAGVLPLEEILPLVAARARLIDALPEGGMLAVPLALAEAEARLGAELAAAAVNGPEVTVVAGPWGPLEALADELAAEGLPCRRLPTAHAFHSPSMEPVAGELTDLARGLSPRPPEIPYLSNVTGTWITPEEVADPEYWARHLCRPVQLHRALTELWREPGRVFVEVGAGGALGALALQHPDRPAGAVVVPSLPAAHEASGELATLLTSLGELWLAGAQPDWEAFWAGERRRRLVLPTYPFQRRRFWVEPAGAGAAPARGAGAGRGEAQPFRPDIFRRVPLEPEAAGEGARGPWLVFLDPGGVGEALAGALEASGDPVVRVAAGGGFARRGGAFEVAPGDPDSYRALVEALVREGEEPRRAVHLLSLGAGGQRGLAGLEEVRERGFTSLLALARAWEGRGPLELTVVSGGLYAPAGGAPDPALETLRSALAALAREAPEVTLRSLDLDPAAHAPPAAVARLLAAELAAGLGSRVVALRGEARWVPADAGGAEAARSEGPAGEAAAGALEYHPRPNLRTPYVAPETDLERQVAGVWRRVLGIEEVGVHDDFFSMGGHSLLAPRLLLSLGEDLGMSLPLPLLFQAPTVRELSAAVERARREGLEAVLEAEELDLPAEVTLDPEIRPAAEAVETWTDPAVVFLTGASGFVGAFLLDELLRRTRARVVCLVRAGDDAEAGERLRRNLETQKVWRQGMEARLTAVAGDLTEPRFALPPERFEALAREVEAVYHAGAWVNFTYPYRVLAPTNVGGTREALRLAAAGRTKPFHFVSTIAVFSPGSLTAEGWAREDSPLPSCDGLFSGYAESKWVAEKVVELARGRGIPTTVHRPAVVGGHSGTGAGNARDLVWNLFLGSVELGAAMDGMGTLDVAPVDAVAGALVHLSLQPASLGKAFHYPNPETMPWDHAFEVVRELGYPLRMLPPLAWRRELEAAVARGEDNALVPFLPMLASGSPAAAAAEGAPVEDPGHGRAMLHDGSNTHGALAGSGVRFPPVSRDLIRTYMSYFIESGFLPPPPEAGPDEPSPAMAGARR